MFPQYDNLPALFLSTLNSINVDMSFVHEINMYLNLCPFNKYI
jgi:hypothetical protein